MEHGNPKAYKPWLIRSVLIGTAGLAFAGAFLGATGLGRSEYQAPWLIHSLLGLLAGAIYGFMIGLVVGLFAEFYQRRK